MNMCESIKIVFIAIISRLFEAVFFIALLRFDMFLRVMTT